jgi:hypothetical protein
VAKKKDYEGQSGNPAGRPKGKVKVASPGEVFGDVMAGLIPVNDNGKPRNISLMRAFFLSEIKKALNGDPAAAKRVLSMVFTLLDRQQPDQPAADEGPDQDASRDLNRLLDEIAGRAAQAADDSELRREESAEHVDDGPAGAKPQLKAKKDQS